MSDFNIDITKEENDSITLKISSSGNLTSNNLAEAFAKTIEKLVEKEEEKREIKLYFFIWMCKYFVGHKLFLLNRYIVRWMLAYNILKKNINEKVKKTFRAYKQEVIIMSNWTHVAGIIRVDCLPIEELDFDKLIGEEWHFGDEFYIPKTSFLPDGSEGSLYKSVWEDLDGSIARYTVSIFGDLRDREDPQKIIDWFKKKCEKLWVRQAIITVWNERNGTIDWRYEHVDD